MLLQSCHVSSRESVINGEGGGVIGGAMNPDTPSIRARRLRLVNAPSSQAAEDEQVHQDESDSGWELLVLHQPPQNEGC